MVGQRHVKASGSGCCFGPARPQVHPPLCRVATTPPRARMPPPVPTPCALPALRSAHCVPAALPEPPIPEQHKPRPAMSPVDHRSHSHFVCPRSSGFPLNGALLQNFRALRAPSAEDGACGAGHCQPCPPPHVRAGLAFHSLTSARVPRRKLICALQRQNFRALRALEGAFVRRIGSMPRSLTRPRGRGRLMWPCHARCCP